MNIRPSGMENPSLSLEGSRSPPAHRRRDKAQLSCNPCRRRKIKCDRLLPCSGCRKRDSVSICQYPAFRTPEKPSSSQSRTKANTAGLRERLNTLENQIVALVQEPNAEADLVPQPDNINRGYGITPEASRVNTDGTRRHGQFRLPTGSLSMSPVASTYVAGAHWVAILGSIAELKEQIDVYKRITPTGTDDDQGSEDGERAALLFGFQGSASKEALVAAMPEKPVVDRLVAQYFNDLDMMSYVSCLHTTAFLRQYDKFWENPCGVSVNWLGLLYSIMCLCACLRSSSLSKQYANGSLDYKASQRPLYLDQVVHCLRLSEYSRGGPHILETLVHYYMIEHLRRPNTEVDVWLLLGILLRLAIRMGYHRDPLQFQNITPFEAEMRRRIWISLYSADVMLSMQVGVPRMLQDSQSDTRPPLNLQDSDFDESFHELPPPRNDNEVTPIFYILARYKMAKVMGVMMDIINTTHYDESEIARAEKLLQDTYDALPSILKITPSSNTLADSSRTILHRFVLATALHCAQIVLHQHCISAPGGVDFTRPNHSLDTLLNAALNVLMYQHAIDAETQAGGRLWAVRWRFSSTLTHEFLLAMTVLSKALFSTLGPNPFLQAGSDMAVRIRSELQETHRIWLRLSHQSKVARQAADVLTSLFDAIDTRTRNLELTNGDNIMVDLEHYLELNLGALLPSCLF